ncbi:hypothetical protein [Mycolicibacter sinensis]|uniref:Lipoprotein LpqE n=1 Tax=Mycolicibacter sinensis (strain JDM601) TaxID=875328 RepID=A0A1A2ED06_MYCSD|nr:hypothetical protein [Mycolicibacter sinensis]OBG02599.1 hypothetical protein A5772_07710 [Mycolicibacter sinensis]OBG03032.1 hypothetical protein A5771_13855 [Mycolicibacter sinensis]
MNRFNRVVTALAVAAALAGCGTGQISQSADQASAVNGASATVGELALRDVRIQAVQAGDALEAGQTVDLVFVASNRSTDTGDELTGINSSVGKVSVIGAKSVPAGGVLIVSAPAGPDQPTAPASKALPEVTNASTAAAAVTLDKAISNGLTYDFTFDFKKAGPIRVAVPISAGTLLHP